MASSLGEEEEAFEHTLLVVHEVSVYHQWRLQVRVVAAVRQDMVRSPPCGVLRLPAMRSDSRTRLPGISSLHVSCSRARGRASSRLCSTPPATLCSTVRRRPGARDAHPFLPLRCDRFSFQIFFRVFFCSFLPSRQLAFSWFLDQLLC
jgi:hypothetical protein